MRKTSIKTIIALALSSSAIAAEPFSFEGTWYFDRYNPLNNGLLQVKDCRYASCDIELQTIWGNKSCALIPMKELLGTTGYIRGACSPLGMKKHFPTYVHAACQGYDFIYVSAGQRGLQIKVSPADLIRVAQMQVAELV